MKRLRFSSAVEIQNILFGIDRVVRNGQYDQILVPLYCTVLFIVLFKQFLCFK